MWMLILAQAADAATPANPAVAVRPWWQVLLDNGLALTILFIFLSAIVGVVLNVRRKDKCLKLMHDYHVGYLTTAGKALWGDLTVYSQGVELTFDTPYTTRRGLVKNSALIYPEELANCLAICRVESALTDAEVRQRRRQVRRSFSPGLIRRMVRSARNLLSTLRDAFSKAMSAILGAIIKSRPGAAVASQQGQIDQIGQTVLGAAGNAYEPMLEAHIGRPVILKVTRQTEQQAYILELPGYLVDYTQHYVAVFNVEHDGGWVHEHELAETLEAEGYRINIDGDDVTIACDGPDPLVVEEVHDGAKASQLSLPLIPGTQVTLRREADAAVKLKLRLTRQIDVVCPRSLAKIYFGSESTSGTRPDWRGLAPEQDAEASESPTAESSRVTLFGR